MLLRNNCEWVTGLNQLFKIFQLCYCVGALLNYTATLTEKSLLKMLFSSACLVAGILSVFYFIFFLFMFRNYSKNTNNWITCNRRSGVLVLTFVLQDPNTVKAFLKISLQKENCINCIPTSAQKLSGETEIPLHQSK